MTSFPRRIALADPAKTKPIPGSDLAYIRTRNRLSAFNAVKDEFQRSGITQKELAERLNMNAGQLSRLLGAPGNWTLDTVAELLWAISGARTTYPLEFPLTKAKRNNTRPSFAKDIKSTNTTTTKSMVFNPKLGSGVNAFQF